MGRWDLDATARLAALEAVGLIPGLPEDVFDPYTRLVTRLLGVPVALVSLVDAERQFFPSSIGLDEPWASKGETPLSLSFCKHVVMADAAFVVTDAVSDPRVQGNRAVEDLGVVAYLGTPLHAPGGEPLGSLCAIASEPRRWSDADLEALEDVAAAASQALGLLAAEHRQRSFSRTASHAMRTPIAAARLELESALAGGPIDDEAEAGLRAAVGHLSQLSGIVDDLLDASKEAAREGLEEVDLGELAAEVVAALAGDAGAAGGPEPHVLVDVEGVVVARTFRPALARAVRAMVEHSLAQGGDAATVRVRAEPGAHRLSVLASGGAIVEREGGSHLGIAAAIARRLGGHLDEQAGPPRRIELLLPRSPGS